MRFPHRTLLSVLLSVLVLLLAVPAGAAPTTWVRSPDSAAAGQSAALKAQCPAPAVRARFVFAGSWVAAKTGPMGRAYAALPVPVGAAGEHRARVVCIARDGREVSRAAAAHLTQVNPAVGVNVTLAATSAAIGSSVAFTGTCPAGSETAYVMLRGGRDEPLQQVRVTPSAEGAFSGNLPVALDPTYPGFGPFPGTGHAFAWCMRGGLTIASSQDSPLTLEITGTGPTASITVTPSTVPVGGQVTLHAVCPEGTLSMNWKASDDQGAFAGWTPYSGRRLSLKFAMDVMPIAPFQDHPPLHAGPVTVTVGCYRSATPNQPGLLLNAPVTLT